MTGKMRPVPYAHGAAVALVAGLIGCSDRDASTMAQVSDGVPEVPESHADRAESSVSHEDRIFDRLEELMEGGAEARKENFQQIVSLYAEWGSLAGEAAVESAAANVGALGSDRPLIAALAGWIDTDGEAARTWVRALDTTQARRRSEIARAFLSALPADDHESRKAWVAESADDAAMITQFVSSWSESDSQAAASWLIGLEETDGRRAGLELVMRKWTRTDPETASSFVVQLDGGPARDTAVRALVTAVSADDPERARLWAETISDENLRQKAFGLLVAVAAAKELELPE